MLNIHKCPQLTKSKDLGCTNPNFAYYIVQNYMNYDVRSAGHGLFAYLSSHRRLPFSNMSASFDGDTAPIDLKAFPGSSIKQTHKLTRTPVKKRSLGADVKELFFLFRSFPLFLNKDANPLLWLQSRAR